MADDRLLEEIEDIDWVDEQEATEMNSRLRSFQQAAEHNGIMKPDVKQAWVDALRHGGYSQTREQLRRGNESYCCLGVLSDIMMPIEDIGTWSFDEEYNFWHIDEWDELPPPAVGQCTGVSASVMTALAGLNDAGVSFNYIADLIEEYL